MTQSTYEPPSDNDGDAGDVSRDQGVGTAAASVAPAAMGSGSATPLAAPEVLGGESNSAAGATGGPDDEAFASGEDEVGGSGGPAGGTARP
jgi:hypothetical protein